MIPSKEFAEQALVKWSDCLMASTTMPRGKDAMRMFLAWITEQPELVDLNALVKWLSGQERSIALMRQSNQGGETAWVAILAIGEAVPETLKAAERLTARREAETGRPRDRFVRMAESWVETR